MTKKIKLENECGIGGHSQGQPECGEIKADLYPSPENRKKRKTVDQLEGKKLKTDQVWKKCEKWPESVLRRKNLTKTPELKKIKFKKKNQPSTGVKKNMGENVQKITSFFETLKPTEMLPGPKIVPKFANNEGVEGEILAVQEKGLGMMGGGRGGNIGAGKGGGVRTYGPVDF